MRVVDGTVIPVSPDGVQEGPDTRQPENQQRRVQKIRSQRIGAYIPASPMAFRRVQILGRTKNQQRRVQKVR